MVEEMDRLQREFDDFRSTPISLEKPKDDFVLIDRSMRIEELESRLSELEKMFAVFNKNWKDYREIIDRKVEDLKNVKPTETMSENVQQELLSLREIVKTLSNRNQELGQRLEQTASHQLLGEMTTKISSFENKLSEVEEKLKKDFWSRPVVIE